MARLEWRFAAVDPALERIRERCVMDSETGCWHWRGAMNSDARSGRIPVIWHDGRSQSGLRAVFELSGRRPARMVWRTCGCDDCLSPHHLLTGSRADWGRWRVRTGASAPTPEWCAQNKRASKSRAVLSDAAASIIRTSDKSGVALAEEFGVSKTAISRVRRGQTWTGTVQGASVFGWRP